MTFPALIVLLAPLGLPLDQPLPPGIEMTRTDKQISIVTEALSAQIHLKGYVSGIAAGSFVDRKTGARELGFGLHIMDFLLAPGWRDDGYLRDAKLHGQLPKHYVEGPQICTQAKELTPEIIVGKDFVAIRLSYRFHKPGEGYKAGSVWEQTLLFQPKARYVLASEQITSVNTVNDLFYRIDMPGHIKHQQADNFTQIYLSYRGQPIPASEFLKDFGPDERYLYQRGKQAKPERMIRAYQVKVQGKAGPWLAGMTLDPEATSEAWCHQRGYVCFIQELHRRQVKAGETFGAAYLLGWFDGIDEMNQVYDRHRGASRLQVSRERFELK